MSAPLPVFPAPLLQWATALLNDTTRLSPSPLPSNLTAASGNTYKNMYEATTMSSGLYFVFLVNIVVAWLGILFYRYVILREAGLLSPEEVRLLRKYPSVPTSQSYTPTDAFARAPPPMRWTTWRDFFTSSETVLSRDAQVYLLFQRACIVTTAICATVASVILLPCYWLGGAVFKTDADRAPSLLSLLKSDRGVFERFTSHNLPPDSPLVMLQLPVILVTALCVIVIYTIVKAAAGEQRSVQEWLNSGHTNVHMTAPLNSPLAAGSPKLVHWTLFARGLPLDIQEADELAQLLEALYPGQVVKVELVCKGKMSEARLLRTLSSARNRLEYLYEIADEPVTQLPEPGPITRLFSFFVGRRTTTEMIKDLEERVDVLQKDFESRKADRVSDFSGCAFITFRTSTAAGAALSDFPVQFDGPIDWNQEPFNSDCDMTIGRHSRVGSDWRFPRLHSLYKGTVNLLPYRLRERVFASPNFAPSQPHAQAQAHQSLLRTIPEGETVSAEVATAKLRNMKAERAPKSGDIIWRNIGISFFERTVREMVVQVVVFTILILFTSPVAMLTALKLVFAELALLSDPQMIFSGHHNATTAVAPLRGPLNETNGFDLLNNLSSDGGNAVEAISKDLMSLLPPFLSSNTVLRSALLAYLPVLLLAVVFAIVPSLLRLTCSLEGYPTYSAQEMSVFRKTSFYYLMNALVLPSLALNTASEFLEMVYKQSGGGANVYNALPILQRLFSGDIAFFLCNYLVQLALTGSVFWLLRLPNSFSMMVRRRRALTPLEAAEAKCTDIFDYPRHYAYNVTVMSMCLLFGFMAPLVWHFALFYFVCKHSVDVYTIRYVHPRSHIDGRLPRLSANFILTWTTVSQLSLAVIFYLRGWVKAGVVTALLCILTLASCLSVSTRVGNRLLRIVAGWRDQAIDRIMRLAGSDYEWMPSSTLVNSSSTSSSTQSLPDSRESDALLLKDPLVRRISLEIGSMKDLRTSSVRTGILSNTPESKGRLKRSSSSIRGGDATAEDAQGTELDEAGDSQEDEEILRDDVEGGRARRITQYGTCDPVEKENIPHLQEGATQKVPDSERMWSD